MEKQDYVAKCVDGSRHEFSATRGYYDNLLGMIARGRGAFSVGDLWINVATIVSIGPKPEPLPFRPVLGDGEFLDLRPQRG